jgi:hypothetical protein
VELKTTHDVARLPLEPKENEQHLEMDKRRPRQTPTTKESWIPSQKKFRDISESLPEAYNNYIYTCFSFT